MLGKTVFFKTCFINKLYKYKWHVTFLLPTYILYKTTKIPDARTYFTPLSCNEDNTLSFNIHHPLLGTWHWFKQNCKLHKWLHLSSGSSSVLHTDMGWPTCSDHQSLFSACSFLPNTLPKNFSFSTWRQAQNRYGISSPYILCNLQTDIPVQCLI